MEGAQCGRRQRRGGSGLAAVTAVFLDSTLLCGSSAQQPAAGGSELNDYIDDSFKANGDDDDDSDEIEEPKLLPHSLSMVLLCASDGYGAPRRRCGSSAAHQASGSASSS